MDFTIPTSIQSVLDEIDAFIDSDIKPLEAQDDNIRFFDHRREDARTDWDRDGLPNEAWESLLAEAKRRAIAAGIFSYPFPKEHGGRDGSNLGMAIIREHLAVKGLGLHNDLQNEHSIVGNNIGLLLMLQYGTEAQKADWLPGLKTATKGFAFGITEPDHGSDATHMESTAVRDGDEWVINGVKTWNTGVHKAHSDMVMARSSGKAGDAHGITAFLVPMDAPGVEVEEYLWTFNMPRITRECALPTFVYPTTPFLAAKGEVCSGAALLTRTGFAKRLQALARRSIALTSRWPMHRSASPSANHWRVIRRSSSPWSICKPDARCCEP